MSNHRHSFSGKKIDPPEIFANMNITEMIDLFRKTGYNARRLAEAADIMKRMIETDATICLTIAGALTPIGFGRIISTMIENGFVDWIVTTGANAYHDLHFAYDLPVRQGHFDVDDDVLYSKQIVRIYDVYIKEFGTLQSQDTIIQKNIQKIYQKNTSIVNNSTADLSYFIGKEAAEKSKAPEKSFMVSAFKSDVPVYIPALSDSSIGLNMLPSMLDGKTSINPIKDIAESTAILWKSNISGGIELGGGVPKNFFQQTGPALYQILKIKEGGHDYIVQLTDARPDTGGLSGATLQEGKSWGKIKTSHRGNVIVYGDSSVYFPILCCYLLNECKPKKKKKQIYKKKDSWVEEMKIQYMNKMKKTK